MKQELRMEYLETIYQRYRKSAKESKGKIVLGRNIGSWFVEKLNRDPDISLIFKQLTSFFLSIQFFISKHISKL